MRLFAAAILLCGVLTACSDSGSQVAATPREPDANAIGYYCQMTLNEHPGPKGQVLLKGASAPLWFSSVKDALTYVEQELPNENELAGFWVNDMSKGSWEKPAIGSWIEAASAWYVLDSKKTAAMGGVEAIPFKDRAGAETFARQFGGRVGGYSDARGAVAAALSGESSHSGGAS